MACVTCGHPQRREIERQSRAGTPATMISAWTRTTEGGYLSRLAIGRHLREHVGVRSPAGRRPVADDFLTAVRDRAHERLAEGDLEPNLTDGVRAQVALDQRQARGEDRDLMLKIAAALSGTPPPRNVTPADELLDAWLDALADGRDRHDGIRAVEAVAERLGLPAGDAVAWVTQDSLPGETAAETHRRIAELGARVGSFG